VTSPPPAKMTGNRRSSTTSRKRLKLLRAEKRPVERDDDPEAAAEMRAWLERVKWGHGPSR
jgi:hypothetical protein